MVRALTHRRFTVPNSLAELNQYSNTSVVYNDDRDYAITFSANAASNTSITINEDQSFVVPTGIDIVSVLSQPSEIIYNIDAPGGTGYWPTLPVGITSTKVGNVFSIRGTFSGDTWTAAKGLTLTFPDQEADFSFTANIQYPDPANTLATLTHSWSNNVDIDQTYADFTATQAYTYAEDSPVTFVYNILDNDPTATSYTLTFDQISGTAGVITINGMSAGIGNVATLTGNLTAVNTANVSFWPYPDSNSTVEITISGSKINGLGNISFASNVLTTSTCTSTHDEYSLTDNYTYAENTTTNLVFDVLDQDASNPTYTITLAQSSGSTGMFYINNVAQGVGNSAVVVGNISTVNAANVAFLPAVDTAGNVALTYTQSKTTPYYTNFVQANAVPMSLTCNTTYNDYSLTTSYGYAEDTGNVLAFQITDPDTRATSYTVSFEQTSGNLGVFTVNGVSQGIGNAVVLSNTRANINTANVAFFPPPDYTGAIGIVYNQIKTNSVYGNVTQASNVPVTFNCVTSNDEYTLTTSYGYAEDVATTLGFEITDTDPDAIS